ncbi:holin [Aureibacillus halotolerans]|uniref:A118-like holin Hol118 n=1 Tax=Aureibacillus halotolerans TaxID=1508390 RepID=A0A4V3D5F8_9BACI|nr:holin [Aureibacillus halotolerans]TDQ39787.1 A118-like holin Hol118 [Aureibacillus halotolerans]
MEDILILSTTLVPIVTALVEILKRAFRVPKHMLPLLSVIVGLVLGGLAFPFMELELSLRLWAGGLAGLAGTGLFEVGNKRYRFKRKKK